MSNLKEYKLCDIASVQTGPFGSQLHMSDYKQEGTPIITVEHLGANRIIHSNLPLVSNEDKLRLNKYTLLEGDIVFSRVGSVDRSAYVSVAENDWMFSGRLLRVRSNKNIVNPKYLSYYFSQETFREHIRMIAVGATMPSINTEILSNVLINLPDLPTQKKTAAILSSLDEKIDLLHRQNKTLEQLAETLFRQWFVENNNDGELDKIGKYISVKGGTTPSTKINEFWDGDLNWTSPRDLSNNNSVFLFDTERKITIKGLQQISSGLLPIGTVLLSSRAPIGYLAISDIPVAINQGYIAIICDKLLSNYFVYCWVKHNLELIINASNGSTFDEISKSVFKDLEIKVPPKNLLLEFNLRVSPFFQKIKINSIQIRSLIKTRDSLLPKLISGEINIKI